MHDRTHALTTFAGVVLGMFAAMTVVTCAAEPPASTHPEGPGYSIDALIDAGLKVDTLIDLGELGRLVSAGLVHTSRAHLAVNAVGLLLTALFWWRVNPALRRSRDAWVLAAIAIIASTGGFLASYLVRAGPSGGSSAGIFGLLAAVAGATWVHRKDLPERMRLTAPIALTLLSFAAVVVMLGRSGMDHAAHLGGWALGLPAGAAAQLEAGRVVLALVAVTLIGLALAT